ncbi:MAG: CooT family nickel-binding protein [Pseudomonadota bacterium]
MCEANAYLVKGGEEQLLMESVDIVEPDGAEGWLLVNIFGEQRTVTGRIRGMNLVDHKIFFESPAR